MRSQAVGLIAALALGGCADDGRHVRSYAPPGCTTTATGDSSVSVVLLGDRVSLEPDRTTGGRVAFVVRNAGRRTHSFQVARVGTSAPSVIGGIEAIPAGEVCATTVELSPGSYQVYCDVDDHFAAGEHAVLRVA